MLKKVYIIENVGSYAKISTFFYASWHEYFNTTLSIALTKSVFIYKISSRTRIVLKGSRLSIDDIDYIPIF